MKQKIFILGFLILLVAVLAGLNAASYTQKETVPDSEVSPNRSTFNPGATGTQAYFSLLSETGRKATRWQQAPAALLTASANARPAVFVITGNIKRAFSEPDTVQLLRWVSEGGRLVVIDREPPDGLAVTTSSWKVEFENETRFDVFDVDPSDQTRMTADTPAIKPVQPGIFSSSVNAVQPSRLASTVNIEPISPGKDERISSTVESPTDSAPLIHFATADKNLVVEAPFGSGKIVFVTDPYIVSNAGIAIADNAQLGINLVATNGGIVAFDEYHQGYGIDNNRFIQFFAGTPVVAIFVQAVVLIGFIFYSQSRRFARPVPEAEPDRLSKLEYVAAMAELQSRTRAYDLAIENIYNEFRRRAARLFGLEIHQATSRELAIRIAERVGLDRSQTETTLFKCEEIIRGEPTNKKQVVALTSELREIERKLGLTRTRRATK
ncbi:MAG: DUF4350 domain-containing protein [Acidobacteria bacterium]|nr:DUF4350 domain-containing protein [Acidobacteriota bacterium]MBP7474861.1 DUF4350 domain-containing protein [Pyrinomonadaceae bacterium]